MAVINQTALSTNLGLPLIPATSSSELTQELFRVYNAFQALALNLDAQVIPFQEDQSVWDIRGPDSTLKLQNLSRLYVKYGVNAIAGTMMALDTNGEAIAAGGTPWAGDTRGFCSVQGGVTSGNYGEMQLAGYCPFVSGLTPGATYYTSDVTSGSLVLNFPVSYVQPIGYALSENEFWFNPGYLTIF